MVTLPVTALRLVDTAVVDMEAANRADMVVDSVVDVEAAAVVEDRLATLAVATVTCLVSSLYYLS